MSMAGFLSSVWFVLSIDSKIMKVADDVIQFIKPIREGHINLNPCAICVDGNNVVWTGCHDGGYVHKIVDGEVVAEYVLADVNCLCVDKDNVVWIGKDNTYELFKIENDVLSSHMDIERTNAGTDISNLCVDMNNNIWVTYNDSGFVFKLSADRTTFEYSGFGHTSSVPTAICCDLNNHIWIADNSKQLFKIDAAQPLPQGVLRSWYTDDGVPFLSACYMCIDKDNVVYVVDSGAGIYTIINDVIHFIAEFTGDSYGGDPTCVGIDINGALWVNLWDNGVLYSRGRIVKVANLGNGQYQRALMLNTESSGSWFQGDMTGMQWQLFFGDPSTVVVEHSQINGIMPNTVATGNKKVYPALGLAIGGTVIDIN